VEFLDQSQVWTHLFVIGELACGNLAHLDDTVSARRGITLPDLLTCCMGFGLTWPLPEGIPSSAVASEQGIVGHLSPASMPTPDERSAAGPTAHQSGCSFLGTFPMQVTMRARSDESEATPADYNEGLASNDRSAG
jgi:hypothetical protein